MHSIYTVPSTVIRKTSLFISIGTVSFKQVEYEIPTLTIPRINALSKVLILGSILDGLCCIGLKHRYHSCSADVSCSVLSSFQPGSAATATGVV